MTGDTRSQGPFDDRAALEELERLQQSIRAYRRQREQAEGAFEQFVGSFRPPVDEPRPPRQTTAEPQAPGAAPSAPAEPWREATEPQARPVPGSTPDPVTPPFPEPFPEELPSARAGGLLSEEPDVPAALSSVGPGLFAEAKPSGHRRRLLLAGVGLALMVAFVVTLRVLQAPSRQAAPTQSQTAAPAAPTADTPASASAPAPGAPVVETPSASPSSPPAAATPAASSPGTPVTGTGAPSPAAAGAGPAPPAEIRTVRRAWVRVLVDGRREVERELEADARVPLPAGSSYVVRAGDAGAVHFILKGQDLGPLGADAQVVTRTFPVPLR